MWKQATRGYQALLFFGAFLKSPILLLLRIYWGTAFAIAGWGKLNEITPFVQFLTDLHFPFPTVMAYLAAATECIGGACLIVGFASRLVAIPLAITMIVAYLTAHVEAVEQIFSAPKVFVSEAPFNFLLTSLLVLAFGPGRFSVDYALEKWLFCRAEEVPKHQHLH